MRNLYLQRGTSLQTIYLLSIYLSLYLSLFQCIYPFIHPFSILLVLCLSVVFIFIFPPFLSRGTYFCHLSEILFEIVILGGREIRVMKEFRLFFFQLVFWGFFCLFFLIIWVFFLTFIFLVLIFSVSV